MPLTAKQQRFVEEFLVDLNATQAALRAGYSEKTAYSIGNELLKKPEIAEAIETAKTMRAEAVGISAQWVLDQAVRLYRRCTQDVKPLIDRKGLPIFDEEGNQLFAFDARGAAAALTLVGKHVTVKAFEDTLNVKGLEGLGERLARAAQRINGGEPEDG